MADYGGNFIFGRTVSIQMIPAPSERQDNAFFGLHGKQTLFGGRRGRIFVVTGFLAGQDAAELAAARASFLDFDDGIARTLTDTLGVTWSQVVYREFAPTGRITQGTIGVGAWGLLMPYQAIFEGLI